MNEQKISSKSSFWLGIGTAVVIAFVAGFFALLVIVLKEDKGNVVAGNPSAAGAVGNTGSGQAASVRLASITDDDWIKGDRRAPISIVEFSDTECPFCKRFHPTMQQVLDEYDGQVNWVYRHFPLTSLHRKAAHEAEATECAGELGGNEGFWAYIDRLFEITPSNDGLDAALLPQIAEDVGLDREEFASCLASGRHEDKVQDDLRDAAAAGGQGTPYSIIVTESGEMVPFSGAVPFEQIASILDQIL